MKRYETQLRQMKKVVHYIDAENLDATSDVVTHLRRLEVTHAQFVDLCDDWLTSRLTRALRDADIGFDVLVDPNFLTTHEDFEAATRGKANWYFTDFYIQQRKRLNILLDHQGKPLGGKWSFDTSNRRKLPRKLVIPLPTCPEPAAETTEATEYVRRAFPKAVGSDEGFCYPVSRQQAIRSLNDFLDNRLSRFGDFEDAMQREGGILFHSMLTPSLNIGLISPAEVVQAALDRVDNAPINSLEGFLRQIIGWREYIRGVYVHFGRKQRCTNFWQHKNSMPNVFYTAATGIEPVDQVIRKVLRTGYCHHIERLMVLGNFMLLCEIDPDDVYRWFMELFIDAYDWVMVPNVYGMSQYADGGSITTKPYISGSNYIRKMSNYSPGKWCEIWDALYWRFIDKHRAFFSRNPRTSMMISQCDRLGSKLTAHLHTAEDYLSKLHH